jgi:exonuclease SbcC
MKPLRIEMTAFSCYADRQVVDFAELGAGRLFLIHGPTGAGKSTLLDAICFALYGESSGDERKPGDLRSQVAGVSEETSVVFDFAVGLKNYRVERYPEQEIQGKRGSIRKIETRATLWDRSNVTGDAEGVVLATKPRAVNDKVLELLGFNAEQFRQLIVIPQGQFRRLLMADVKERKEILETLFQASYYRQVEQRLKNRASEIEREIVTRRNKRLGLYEQRGYKDRSEIEGKLSALQEIIANLNIENDKSQAALTQHKQVHDKAAEANSKFLEFEAASSELAKLDKQADAIAALTTKVRIYDQAAPLIPRANAIERLIADIKEKEQRLAKVQVDLELQRNARNEANKALALEESRAVERKSYETRALEIDGLKPIFRELAGIKNDLIKAQASSHQGEESLKERSKRSSDLLAQVEREEKRERGLIELSLKLEAFRNQTLATERMFKEREALVAEQAKDGLLKLKNNTQAKEIEKLVFKVNEKDALFSKLQAAWRGSQAALLAAELESNKPCPVCGSLHHPEPRSGGADLVRNEEVDIAGADLEKARQELTKAEKELLKTKGELSVVGATINNLLESLGARSGEDIENLKNELSRLKSSTAQSEAAAAEQAELKARLASIKHDKEQADIQRSQADELSRSLKDKLSQVSAKYEALKNRVPNDIENEDELAKIEVANRNSLDSATVALGAAQKSVQELDKRVSELATISQEIVSSLSESRQFLLKSEEEFLTHSKPLGITSRDELKSILLPANQIEEMREQVDQFKSVHIAAVDRLKRAKENLPTGDKPNIEESSVRLLELEAKCQEQRDRLNSAIHELNSVTELVKFIDVLDGELAELEGVYSSAGRIARLAMGDNPRKMSYQSFVLASYLDDVLTVASIRLKKMSKERYELHRSLDVSDRRTESGLALEILDLQSGIRRPVTTLSGGESFLASLALALGISDVVQSNAGGIQMETIFIDEGFGTLDPEALEMAFKALHDLQSGGRLVGVISHVPELKEMIKQRLEVVPGARGSVARFVI